MLGEISQRIGQPPLIGELLAGLIMDLSVFGLVFPSTHLRVLSNLPVFFLMFPAGLEMVPREIRRAGEPAMVISIIAFCIPLLSSRGTSLLFGLTSFQSLFMGLLLSIIAVPVRAIVLMKSGYNEVKKMRVWLDIIPLIIMPMLLIDFILIP